MAQPANTAKIEELRFKLKTDPKSRLFYQLAEELRRAGQFTEAEQVLRAGLASNPAYLAAWVSLGRVLREQRNDGAAVEALTTALQLDPGNVVAARLLADAYLSLGDKLEAIKKYKLVHALLPADEDVRGAIDRLTEELSPVVQIASEPDVAPFDDAPDAVLAPDETPQSDVFDEQIVAPPFEDEESPFDKTSPPFAMAEEALRDHLETDEATADFEPMHAAHEESPFEEPVSGFTAAAVEIEGLSGFHIAQAPLAAEVAGDVIASDDEGLPTVDAPVIAPEPVPGELREITPSPSALHSGDAADTLTMADLYARQGLVEDARHIYENILAREPRNDDVRAKLEALAPRVNPKVAKLEQWLARVARREASRV